MWANYNNKIMDLEVIDYKKIEVLAIEVKQLIESKGLYICCEFEFLTRLEKVLYEGVGAKTQ
jgi:hypothetical protein